MILTGKPVIEEKIYPAGLAYTPDGSCLIVANVLQNTLSLIDVAKQKVRHTIPVGSRPNHMALSFDGQRLFVACANSGDVYVIDTVAGRVEERLDLRPYPEARPGTTPNGVALSGDGRRLYVANADNDAALGMIIEAVSQSRFWPEMAVFVVEDDAQNGPDHIDAHRTVALVASPYARRGFVDHSQYSTVSMLKTMELILGLPPMTQYDAAAIPMFRAFTEDPDLTPYKAEVPRVDLDASNPTHAAGALASVAMNLEDFDELTVEEEQLLNEAIWKSVKGPDSVPPRPVYWATHWAFGRPSLR